MIKIQNEEEARTPEGNVLIFKPTPATKPVFVWNNYIKEYIYDHEEDDPECFIEFVNGSYKTIKYGYCRSCAEKIEHYNEKFYKKSFVYASWNSEELSEKTCYCRKCAIEKSREVFVEDNPIYKVKDYAYTWTDKLGTRQEWSDGAITETDTKSIKEAHRN